MASPLWPGWPGGGGSPRELVGSLSTTSALCDRTLAIKARRPGLSLAWRSVSDQDSGEWIPYPGKPGTDLRPEMPWSSPEKPVIPPPSTSRCLPQVTEGGSGSLAARRAPPQPTGSRKSSEGRVGGHQDLSGLQGRKPGPSCGTGSKGSHGTTKCCFFPPSQVKIFIMITLCSLHHYDSGVLGTVKVIT